jgi:hypothetical protein
MKSKLLLSLPLVGCLAIASCYPVPDGPRKPPTPDADKTVTSQDQQKIQAQRDEMKKRDEEQKKTEEAADQLKKPEETTTTDKPAEEPKKKGDYAFATPVPGKEGFVFSPYNQKLVDVRDIPSGTLVQDPTYPAAEKKYFRVP